MSNWNSFADFIHMNGHGYYVWCAYGAIYELWSLITRRRAICRRIMREARAAEITLEK